MLGRADTTATTGRIDQIFKGRAESSAPTFKICRQAKHLTYYPLGRATFCKEGRKITSTDTEEESLWMRL